MRRREQRAREYLDERFQQRSVRNTVDRLRPARARSEQQMANGVNSEVETNVTIANGSQIVKIGTKSIDLDNGLGRKGIIYGGLTGLPEYYFTRDRSKAREKHDCSSPFR
ncbi:hypothetical protein AVEN_217642-1 [Araneus ventricosus]|uniref:Uncharacterized protein n=1 Tax=Araneus ventricosus TaxID=182803 RepID=A0A4Y2HK91_ARAVE|nr:hypothetical protein AVEN_217642-1 [Araneus ventricosus]